jgi:hypothetical protein
VLANALSVSHAGLIVNGGVMKIGTVYVLTTETHNTTVTGCYRELETAKRVVMREVKALKLEREPMWFASHENTRLNLEVWDTGVHIAEYTIYTLPLLEDWEV